MQVIVFVSYKIIIVFWLYILHQSVLFSTREQCRTKYHNREYDNIGQLMGAFRGFRFKPAPMNPFLQLKCTQNQQKAPEIQESL